MGDLVASASFLLEKLEVSKVSSTKQKNAEGETNNFLMVVSFGLFRLIEDQV